MNLTEALQKLAREQEWEKRSLHDTPEVYCKFKHDGRLYSFSIKEPQEDNEDVADVVIRSQVYLDIWSYPRTDVSWAFEEAAEVYEEILETVEQREEREAREKILELASPDGVGPDLRPWWKKIFS